MLTKLTKAFEIQWAAAKRDAELAECHALAARNGTTLAVALRRWIDMETLLKEDLTAGIFKICENLGIDPHELARKYLATEAA